jgi:DNA-binding MarR family transcriptional regulator
MAAAPPLEQFVLEETEEGYRLTITAGGQKLAAEVDPDQLDAIIEALESVLGEEDDAFEVDEDDDD